MTNAPILALALALSSAAQAQVTIYAINNRRGVGETSERLVSFQSDNPAGWTSVGLTGAANVEFTGLDFAGVGGGLYAWGSSGSGPVGLFSIDPATGAATFLQQGPPATAIRDLSWNPVTHQMVGLQTNPCRLFSIDLTNGAATLIGEVTGIPSPGGFEVEALAHDSLGNIYIHDQFTDDIYFGAGLAVTTLHQNLPNTDFFSQGMVVDWSGNNQGYHSAFGLVPQFFSDLYTFNSAPNSYTLAGNFGTPHGTFPTLGPGDLAIRPIPAPSAWALLGVALVARRRRR